MPAPVIISLTSYPPRFAKLALTLKCLLTQTVAPDRVVLWIAQNDKDLLPASVRRLAKHGLEIKICEDLRSYKKIVPILLEAPDAFIVTADDDAYYWPTWLKELLNASRFNEHLIVCHRAHRIRLDDTGSPLPYKDWESDISDTAPSSMIFPTGVGGILFPPRALGAQATDFKLFTALCPEADDVWLYWMARLKGCRFSKVGPRRLFILWSGTQRQSLGHSNVVMGGNDAQIQKMIERFGLPAP